MVRYNTSILAGQERPKPSCGIREDENFFYTYSQTCKLESKRSKTPVDQYYDWLQFGVRYRENKGNQSNTGFGNQISVDDRGAIRLTPPSEYETSLGLGAFNPHSYGTRTFTGRKNVVLVKLKKVVDVAIQKTLEKEQAEQAEQLRLAKEAREQLQLAKLREAKPKKETVFVAPPETVEEAVKYSPLLIAGIGIIVFIIILRRRA